MKEKLKKMTNAELIARRDELKAIGENPESRSADELEQLAEERTAIDEELTERRAAAAREQLRRDDVANGRLGGNVLGMQPQGLQARRSYNSESPEYRTGFLKTLLQQELTAEERDAVAYVMTTGDSTHHTEYLLPKTLLNEIWSLIEEEHSILEDIQMYRTGTILEIPLHLSIAQGDAKSVNENAANDDEINNWGHVVLSGKDFSKNIEISYAMAKMSIDALEDYLRQEISERLGSALAKDAVTQILADYDDTNNAVTTAEENVVAYKDITDTMATLKNGKGAVRVYANSSTVMKYLVGMVDTTGRPIFQPDAQAAPQGSVVGRFIRPEDAVQDGVFLIGYPKRVVGNMIQDIMLETDRDIKKHKIIYSGYARAEFKLAGAKAFATLTVDAGE